MSLRTHGVRVQAGCAAGRTRQPAPRRDYKTLGSVLGDGQHVDPAAERGPTAPAVVRRRLPDVPERAVGATREDLHPAVGVLPRRRGGRSSRPVTPSRSNRCSARSATCATRRCRRRWRKPRGARRRCARATMLARSTHRASSSRSSRCSVRSATCATPHRRRRARRSPDGRRRCGRPPSRSTQPPSDAQPLQPLLGAVCHLCHTAPSAPRAKISRRPSAFVPVVRRSTQPPSEAQPLQPLFGAVCH